MGTEFTDNETINADTTIYAKWSLNSQVSTFAGSTAGYQDGTGTAAQFDGPEDVAVYQDANKTWLYVADFDIIEEGRGGIRKIDVASTAVTTLLVKGALQSLVLDKDANIYVNTGPLLKVDSTGKEMQYATGS